MISRLLRRWNFPKRMSRPNRLTDSPEGRRPLFMENAETLDKNESIAYNDSTKMIRLFWPAAKRGDEEE
jgi:hypothetical protein